MSTSLRANPWSVMLIGLGRIGQGYDYDLAPAEHVFTHARAFSQDAAFRLIAGIDLDEAARQRFTAQYRVPVFAETIEAAALAPDILVIATPTAQHLATVEAALASFTPRAIICEKPLAYSPREAAKLLELCRSRGCAVYVNYMRRSDPTVAALRARLADGHIAFPLKGIVWYSKGLYNSASHFVNLLEDLLGSAPTVTGVTRGRRWPNGDPEPDFTLSYTRGTITFYAACAEDFFHNTMEWISPTGRLRYEQGGAYVDWASRQPATSPDGYAKLSTVTEALPTDFNREQAHFTAQLALALAGRPAAICTGVEALATLELLHRIQPFESTTP